MIGRNNNGIGELKTEEEHNSENKYMSSSDESWM